MPLTKNETPTSFKMVVNVGPRTQIDIAQADAILLTAVNMETGIRGYLLLVRHVFLEPYNQGKAQFYHLIKGS